MPELLFRVSPIRALRKSWSVIIGACQGTKSTAIGRTRKEWTEVAISSVPDPCNWRNTKLQRPLGLSSWQATLG